MGNKNSTVEEALRRASSYFKEAGLEQPRDEAEILLAHLLGWDRLKLFLERSSILGKNHAAAFQDAVERRSRGEPVAYIIGSKEFYGLEFVVSRDVLIPRPETELVIDAALEWARSREGGICGADLGCGSGNLAVTLAHHLPQALFYAVDLSAEALHLAEGNANRHGVSARVSFFRGCYLGALAGIEPSPRFNLVVANPPYLSAREIEALPPTIKDYEPRLALDGGLDGLSAYRSILAALPSFIRGPGLFALEIGAAQGGEILQLCRRSGIFRDLSILHDLRDLPRVLLGLF